VSKSHSAYVHPKARSTHRIIDSTNLQSQYRILVFLCVCLPGQASPHQDWTRYAYRNASEQRKPQYTYSRRKLSCRSFLEPRRQKDTGDGEDADVATLPDLVLLQQERQKNEHAAVVYDPPDVDGPRQSVLAIREVLDAARHEQSEALGVDGAYGVCTIHDVREYKYINAQV